MLIGMSITNFNYRLNPAFAKAPDWNAAFAYIQEHAEAGDALVYTYWLSTWEPNRLAKQALDGLAERAAEPRAGSLPLVLCTIPASGIPPSGYYWTRSSAMTSA